MVYHRVRDLREDHDLKQKELAEFLNCSQQVYSNYELGQRDIPTEILIRLSEFYHVSVDYLLDDDVIETSLSVNHFQQDYERYLISHFKHLSSLSKKELLDFLQFLEQRDKSSRNHTT